MWRSRGLISRSEPDALSPAPLRPLAEFSDMLWISERILIGEVVPSDEGVDQAELGTHESTSMETSSPSLPSFESLDPQFLRFVAQCRCGKGSISARRLLFSLAFAAEQPDRVEVVRTNSEPGSGQSSQVKQDRQRVAVVKTLGPVDPLMELPWYRYLVP